jgi:hypothetical protein
MECSFFRENSKIFMPKRTSRDSVYYKVVDVTGTVEIEGGFPKPYFHHNDPEVTEHMGNPVEGCFTPVIGLYLPGENFAEAFATVSHADFYRSSARLFSFLSYPPLRTVPDDIAGQITGKEFYVTPQPIGEACLLFPRKWFLFIDKDYVDQHLEDEVTPTGSFLTDELMKMIEDDAPNR